MLASFGISEAGPVRVNNEDCFLSDDALSLYVVADGMGGHAAGEVASRLAVDAIDRFIRGAQDPAEVQSTCGIDPRLSYTSNRLRTAICLANKRVCEAAEAHPEYSGMGTTVVCALLDGGTVTIGHVGDSRLYVLADGKLMPQTQDDTWAAFLLANANESGITPEQHPLRNVLTNVLGAREDADIHITERELTHGQMLLLCTDGVHGVLDDDELCVIMSAGRDPDAIAKAVVAAAFDRGSRDNATAIVVRYRETASD
jgi:PPM family protein phosphatase